MRSRFIIVLLSLIFAAVATFGAAYYIAKVKASVTEGQELVEVVVIKKPVEAGTSVAEMIATGSVASERIPKQYVADSALLSTEGYSDRVLTTSLAAGEQLTDGKFKNLDDSGLAYKVPENMIAVSIAVDEVTGVSGRLQPGDKVDVIATFSPGPGDRDMTKVMLQNVEILATSYSGTGDNSDGITKAQQSGIDKKTVTLIMHPSHAEKLVFAVEKGHIWLGLRHTGDGKINQSTGQVVETVFK